MNSPTHSCEGGLLWTPDEEQGLFTSARQAQLRSQRGLRILNEYEKEIADANEQLRISRDSYGWPWQISESEYGQQCKRNLKKYAKKRAKRARKSRDKELLALKDMMEAEHEDRKEMMTKIERYEEKEKRKSHEEKEKRIGEHFDKRIKAIRRQWGIGQTKTLWRRWGTGHLDLLPGC
jgi:hypothetical protein